MYWKEIDHLRLPEKEVLAANFTPGTIHYKDKLLGYLVFDRGRVQCTNEQARQIIDSCTHYIDVERIKVPNRKTKVLQFESISCDIGQVEITAYESNYEWACYKFEVAADRFIMVGTYQETGEEKAKRFRCGNSSDCFDKYSNISKNAIMEAVYRTLGESVASTAVLLLDRPKVVIQFDYQS
jgi:hypothetical protein